MRETNVSKIVKKIKLVAFARKLEQKRGSVSSMFREKEKKIVWAPFPPRAQPVAREEFRQRPDVRSFFFGLVQPQRSYDSKSNLNLTTKKQKASIGTLE